MRCVTPAAARSWSAAVVRGVEVELQVLDTGPGIPLDSQHLILWRIPAARAALRRGVRKDWGWGSLSASSIAARVGCPPGPCRVHSRTRQRVWYSRAASVKNFISPAVSTRRPRPAMHESTRLAGVCASTMIQHSRPACIRLLTRAGASEAHCAATHRQKRPRFAEMHAIPHRAPPTITCTVKPVALEVLQKAWCNRELRPRPNAAGALVTADASEVVCAARAFTLEFSPVRLRQARAACGTACVARGSWRDGLSKRNQRRRRSSLG